MQAQRPVLQEWPDDGILLVVTSSTDYRQAVHRIVRLLTQRFPKGVYLTANRPHHFLRDAFAEDGVPRDALQYVDCVSGLTGIMPPPEPGVLYIESPTMLEKTAMRTEQLLRRQPQGERFLVVDSLSTLTVYNGVAAVAELTHNLVNRLRMQQIPAALVLVEKQAGDSLLDAVRPLCDGVVRL
ncbi:MAG: hypothetical protein QOD77_3 [Thermoplasmata archaeon]|jgi:hypothetical protein|nr:hypothetical protein [Thermoplasmata archaeon]